MPSTVLGRRYLCSIRQGHSWRPAITFTGGAAGGSGRTSTQLRGAQNASQGIAQPRLRLGAYTLANATYGCVMASMPLVGHSNALSALGIESMRKIQAELDEVGPTDASAAHRRPQRRRGHQVIRRPAFLQLSLIQAGPMQAPVM
jgi:hypothetical protein